MSAWRKIAALLPCTVGRHSWSRWGKKRIPLLHEPWRRHCRKCGKIQSKPA